MPEAKVCTIDMAINTLIREVGLSDVTPDMKKLSWKELAVDSLGFAQIVAGLEDALEIPIPYEEVKDTKNVEELVSLINSLRRTETI